MFYVKKWSTKSRERLDFPRRPQFTANCSSPWEPFLSMIFFLFSQHREIVFQSFNTGIVFPPLVRTGDKRAFNIAVQPFDRIHSYQFSFFSNLKLSCVFNMHLLHAFAFSKKLHWFEPTQVINLKTQTHAVNAH